MHLCLQISKLLLQYMNAQNWKFFWKELTQELFSTRPLSKLQQWIGFGKKQSVELYLTVFSHPVGHPNAQGRSVVQLQPYANRDLDMLPSTFSVKVYDNRNGKLVQEELFAIYHRTAINFVFASQLLRLLCEAAVLGHNWRQHEAYRWSKYSAFWASWVWQVFLY